MYGLLHIHMYVHARAHMLSQIHEYSSFFFFLFLVLELEHY
uniref:Uncharacterized protein n=1 Tax=Rhizophora mucronata TaxID=61149 RepID=A0A2P2M0P2_RHIMU